MSEVYVDNHHSHVGVHSNTNYSRLNEIEESHRIMLEWIIGIFGAIIGIELLLIIVYTREAIKKCCCRRALRKSGKMVILGELNSKETEKKELVRNEGINEDDV